MWRLLWLAVLVLAHSTAGDAQQPDATAAYVTRGRLTQARQHSYHARFERVYAALVERVLTGAPDLLPSLATPERELHGYQIVPKVVPDAQAAPPGTIAEISRYSWTLLDEAIEREAARLERLEAAVAQLPQTAERPRLEQLAVDYRDVTARRRQIDAHVQYNWYWQGRVERREAITAGTSSVALPDFVRVGAPTSGVRLITVPLYTDIADNTFVESFRSAVESLWRAHVGDEEIRVRLAIDRMPPERLYCLRVNGQTGSTPCTPPRHGDVLDLAAHVARFPKDGAVLTTGAASLRWVGSNGIVLGPQDVTPHVLAHEFGHVLGFPDTYIRESRALGADGYEITELVDLDDIMGAPGVGPVLSRHFEQLLAAHFLDTSFKGYVAGDYQGSLDAARAVLALRPASAEAYNNIAAALASMKRWVEAIDAARQALRLRPDFPLARGNLAWAEEERDKASVPK